MKKAFFLLWLLTGCATTYVPSVAVVRITPGDTLAALAAHYKTPLEVILEHNQLSANAILRPGQVIEIPLGRRYVEERRGRAVAGRRSRQGLLFGGSPSLAWPVEGEVSSRFGRRRGRPHEGIDIRAPRNSEISAAASGTVVHAGWMRGYGHTIVVEHEGFRTLYAHCNALRARKGDWVEEGEVIATVGKSGNASGYHLHFEYRDLAGRTYDPLAFLDRDATLISRR